MLGSGGVIVMNDKVCMVEVLYNIAEFFAEESCGQCTPCRSGSEWIKKIMHRIVHGEGKEGDVELMLSMVPAIALKTICAMGDALCGPVSSFLNKFRNEFDYHIKEKKCDIKDKLQLL